MVDSESWIKRLNCSPEELVILASQVNRICAIEPGNFLPSIHLPDVKNIIQCLDPNLSLRRGLMEVLVIDEDNDSRPARGPQAMTNTGKLLSFSERKKTQHRTARLGKRNGIGIGLYIAEKVHEKRKDLVALSFTQFMDHSLASTDPELTRPLRKIVYRWETLEPVKIIKEEPRIHLGFIVTFKPITIWRR